MPGNGVAPRTDPDPVGSGASAKATGGPETSEVILVKAPAPKSRRLGGLADRDARLRWLGSSMSAGKRGWTLLLSREREGYAGEAARGRREGTLMAAAVLVAGFEGFEGVEVPGPPRRSWRTSSDSLSCPREGVAVVGTVVRRGAAEEGT